MIGKKNKSICLFTSSFPFGDHETYLISEVRVLSEVFERVFIFPMHASGSPRKTPNNVKIEIFDNCYSSNRFFLLKNNFGEIITELFIEIILNGGWKRSFIKQLDYLLKYNYLANELVNFIDKNKNLDFYFYSYWLDEWATTLAISKKRKIISNYISRAHGFDIYNFRKNNMTFPFRLLQLKTVSSVYCVSENGKNYLLNNTHKKYKSKIKLSYLGTDDFGPGKIKSNSSCKLIVSVSNAYPIKRLNLILDSLLLCSSNIKWVHIGDGPQIKVLKDRFKLISENIKIEFHGQKQNHEVIDFLSRNYIDAFVNVSISEGLPVSIMEAISFGIPVIATDVGGVKEIVNEVTGILKKTDIKKAQLSNILDGINTTYDLLPNDRKGIRNFWVENFNLKKNYYEFCKMLIN